MGRVLAFGPLLLPHRGVFVASWGSAWADAPLLGATIESIERLRGSLIAMRILAFWAFALLFAVGPILTWWLGPGAAVVYTATVLYPTIVISIVWLWWQRRDFRLTATRAIWLSIEILICPAFLPNLVRKITTLHAITVDGIQILLAMATAERKDEFLTRLENRIEELIHETSDDEAAQEQLRSYLAKVRGAR